MEDKQSESEIKITSLSHAFIIRELSTNQSPGSTIVRKSILLSLNHSIIICARLFDDSIQVTYFHLATRKVIRRISKHKFINIAHVHDFDPIFVEQKKQHFLGIRFSNSEFHFVSLWTLQTVFKLKWSEGIDSRLSCCFMKGNLITWTWGGNRLHFWKIFEEKPYASIELPFPLLSEWSQLPDRDLLVLQELNKKRTAFIDVAHRKIFGLSSEIQQPLFPTINSENQVFFKQDMVASYSIFCYELSQDLKLQELNKISLPANGTRTFPLPGAGICLAQDFQKTWFYNLMDKGQAFENTSRSKGEFYVALAELRKNKREHCLLTRKGDLLVIYVKNPASLSPAIFI